MRGLNQRHIYGLLVPSEGIIRYVGLTSDPIRRYREHFTTREMSRSNNRKTEWVRECVARGETPIMVLLDCVPEEESRTTELEWIQHFQKLGIDLLNHKKK